MPRAADNDITAGDEVLMYREKPTSKLVGPYIVTSIDEKIMSLDKGDRTLNASVENLNLYNQNDSTTADGTDTGGEVGYCEDDADSSAATQKLGSGQSSKLEALLDCSIIERALEGEDIGDFFFKIIDATDSRVAKDDF